MNSNKIEAVQRALKMLGHYDGSIDGVVGDMTRKGLWIFSKLKYSGYKDVERLAAEQFEGKHVIELRSIDMTHYTGHPIKAWFAAEISETMRAAIRDWETACPGLRITDSIRPINVQINLKQRKPRLAATPGWSMHGHGRAADFDLSSIPSQRLMEFYECFAAHGWYNIHSSPGAIVKRSHEAWHLQRTEPPGINARTYLMAWANERRGSQSVQSALEALVYIKL